MAALVQRFDWARTSLGASENWGISLRSSVDIVLASPVPIVMLCGSQGVMIYNDAYAVFAGGRHPALLGTPVLEGWPEVADFNRRVMEVGMHGGTLSFRDQHLVLHRHGVPEDVWMDLNYSPIRDEEGSPSGVLAIVVETTGRVLAERRRREAEDALRASEERLRALNANLEEVVQTRTRELRQAEEQLHHARRMEAVGQLTGGIAHDFNNLLQALSACLTIVGRRTSEPSIRPLLEAGHQAVDRGGKLTQQLMAFARHQTLRPEPFDIRNRLIGMATLIEGALRDDTPVRMELGPGLWQVEADPTQFELALLNLVVNARDAMTGGGTLEIGAQNCSGEVAGPEGLNGDFVRVWVRDSGDGMAAEVLARAFEPFFTTKAVGKGTGLGLSQVYGFCRQSGGAVRIESEVGKGTIATIILPRAEQPLAEAEADRPVPLAVTAGARVLFVEDDPLVAGVVASTLGDLGYSVTHAKTGDDALASLHAGLPVDVLFSDIVMPGTANGVDLAREAGRLRPGLPVVLATGYSEDLALARDLKVIAKPYRIDALTATIEEALARTGKCRPE